MTFEQWLEQVDVIMVKYCDLDHSDMEDFKWYDEWKAHSTPFDAFIELLNFYC